MAIIWFVAIAFVLFTMADCAFGWTNKLAHRRAVRAHINRMVRDSYDKR